MKNHLFKDFESGKNTIAYCVAPSWDQAVSFMNKQVDFIAGRNARIHFVEIVSRVTEDIWVAPGFAA